MESKFTSGNNIPVERNVITREEWEILKFFGTAYVKFCEEVTALQNSNSPTQVNFNIPSISNADITFPSEVNHGQQITKERIEG